MTRIYFTFILGLWAAGFAAEPNEVFQNVKLVNQITTVQPMTGIVLWDDNESWNNTSDIALEFSYIPYNKIVNDNEMIYDWTYLEDKLKAIAGRGHQAIFRFYYTYVGRSTTIPKFIKNNKTYKETLGKSEKKYTWFPDWNSRELQKFTLDFHSRFAEKYDSDPRIAFIELGFGLQGEYHIYDGPFILGKTFPDKAFQEKFFRHLQQCYKITPWMISIDAADDNYSPFKEKPELLDIPFGLFDDSFMCKEQKQVNEKNWDFFGKERYQTSPAGGEFNFDSDYDQRNALSKRGLYGKKFFLAARQFHITFMIGDDQPRYHKTERIKEASMACGYRFKVVSFQVSDNHAQVAIKNIGVAPIYYDAWPAVNKVRSADSLKGLLPGETKQFTIPAGGENPGLTIECDRLITGQTISFEANLE